MSGWRPISLEKIKTYSIKDRPSKVQTEDFGKIWKSGGTMGEWLDSLPNILAGHDIKLVVEKIIKAVRSEKLVILAMGAHPIKVGLNPIIIDLMERGIIKGLAINGACIIHDTELAIAGKTSEDVGDRLGQGEFGMTEETGRFLNIAINEGSIKNAGLGQAVGAMLVQQEFPYNKVSLLARAFELNIPVTVHVAIGADTIHLHPSANGAAIGRASHLDFRLFADLISKLEGGVYINLGSAVILPEVFLKALTLVRNLGYKTKNITTVNMDFIRHYRPMTNVVQRPTLEGGQGINLMGHHEIMFPLLAAGIIERLKTQPSSLGFGGPRGSKPKVRGTKRRAQGARRKMKA
jgi:hypothetical protein